MIRNIVWLSIIVLYLLIITLLMVGVTSAQDTNEKGKILIINPIQTKAKPEGFILVGTLSRTPDPGYFSFGKALSFHTNDPSIMQRFNALADKQIVVTMKEDR